MSAIFRRGACPGLAEPMRTGDGLLVRLTPTGATIPCAAFVALCAAARRHGNGVIEITSRGSIQFRGFDEASVARFAAAAGAADIPFAEGPPVLGDPLAGLDPAAALDAGAIAAELRRAIAQASFAADLGPKVSVIVDGGGPCHLDAVPADVRLRAAATGGTSWLHLAVGGEAASAAPIGAVAPGHATEAVLRLLGAIAARGQAARARDIIAAEGAEALSRAVSGILVDIAPPPPPVRPPADPVGVHALHKGCAAGIVLTLGHAETTALTDFARAAADAGAAGLRTAPGRALLAVGITEGGAARLLADAESLGFIARAGDPRRRVVACAGAPVCASAQIPARALARQLAGIAAMAGDSTTTVHVSGCAKGCACPRSAPLTVVGIDGGCGVVVDGSARGVPLAMLAPDDVPGALAHLMDTVRRLRAPGESTAAALSRLDRAQIARALSQEAHVA